MVLMQVCTSTTNKTACSALSRMLTSAFSLEGSWIQWLHNEAFTLLGEELPPGNTQL